jgi:adenine-specific DNA-methyltransferase
MHVKKSSIILDFFAGSGTTLHATMKLNAEDGGNRQCILVQQSEGDKNICEQVTYERNKRVINGYTNAKGETVEGLGNSLKYYRTAFVGKNPPRRATDYDKTELSKKAGCLLALAENTLEEIEASNSYQIFSDGKNHYTGVYFTGRLSEIQTFTQKLETLRDQNRRIRITAYFFCWGDCAQFEDEFTSLERISLQPIPKPILDIYQSINR